MTTSRLYPADICFDTIVLSLVFDEFDCLLVPECSTQMIAYCLDSASASASGFLYHLLARFHV
jgi:hypothetical protein